jgi:curli production protein
MVKTALTLLFLAATAVMANEPGYQLRVDPKVEGGMLTVAPRITAPAGAQLRYEVVSSKQGSSGKSNSSQSGNVTAGPDGSAKLSSLSVNVGPQDKYVLTVKVFDGAKLVAEEVVRYPQ